MPAIIGDEGVSAVVILVLPSSTHLGLLARTLGKALSP